MAKLFEYQSKALLKKAGFKIPESIVIESPDELEKAFDLIGPGVLKAQVFTTGRAALGLIKFPKDVLQLKGMADEIFSREVKGQRVSTLLYEEKLNIKNEFYAGVTIDSSLALPVLIFSSRGGSGIEEIAKKFPDSIFRLNIDVENVPRPFEILEKLKSVGIKGKILNSLSSNIINLIKAAIKYEARSLEVNPLILTEEGKVVAADCHMTVDDYAVFRHPEMNIEIARELGHPPTELEKIAYKVEKDDYRGTFYFIQMETGFKKGDGFVGFHGAGGGGSMMSMDAIESRGYRAANFCDTSGNPPASKVYRAAKIILSQPGIDGYFGSGSGVASQEQFHSARGFVKAFREVGLNIPAVVRLGGNGEEKAIKILEGYTEDLSAPVRCFGKDIPVTECAEVFDGLVKAHSSSEAKTKKEKSDFKSDYSFKTVTNGIVSFDYSKCRDCKSKVCIKECAGKILELKAGVPVLNIPEEEASKGKCIECLACEVECRAIGNCGGRITLPVEGV